MLTRASPNILASIPLTLVIFCTLSKAIDFDFFIRIPEFVVILFLSMTKEIME